MKTRDLIIALALVALFAGGAVVKTIEDEKDLVRRTFADWAGRAGIDSDLVLAIVEVESRARLDVVNLSGRDGARGGSYGPTQISAKTAKAFGFTGDPMDFTRDANLAAEWTMKILRARPGGPPTNTNDAAAWWNGGATTLERLAPTNTARTDYAPKLAAAYAAITEEDAS